LIKFKGFEDLERAKKLTNVKIFSSVKETREKISLKSGEYFWFDIIDCKVIEGEKVVGTVSDIHRVFDVDYLNIKTDKSLVKEGMAKSFLIPYLDRYILSVDVEAKKIFVKDSINILEAS
jgi:16S rRNA processing protein RimM